MTTKKRKTPTDIDLENIIKKITSEIISYQKKEDSLPVKEVDISIGFIESDKKVDIKIQLDTSPLSSQLWQESKPKSDDTDTAGYLLPLPEVNESNTITYGSEEIDKIMGDSQGDVSKESLGQVKGYRLIKKIGAGGMSTVYLAENKDYEPRVIKFLTNITTNPIPLQRFFQEIRVSLRLEHANIARVFGFDRTSKSVWYLVMEYIKGDNLVQLVRKNGPFSPKEALFMSLEVASALKCALERNIIHRDLKPENILLEKHTSEIKVIDFGIGKIIGEKEITSQHQIVGTLRYMSPEQITNSKGVDHRTDIYSLGATLYYLLCGKPPYYDVKGNVNILVAMTSQKPRSLLESNVPYEVVQIVEKAMKQNVEERYQTPEEMFVDMQKVYDKL